MCAGKCREFKTSGLHDFNLTSTHPKSNTVKPVLAMTYDKNIPMQCILSENYLYVRITCIMNDHDFPLSGKVTLDKFDCKACSLSR